MTILVETLHLINMEMNYLVLIDFTETSKNALRSALNLTKLNGGKVTALHVLASDNKDEKHLAQKEIRDLKTAVTGEFETQLLEGKLEDTVNSTIDLLSIDYVIMGTHGITGMQKVLGSKALKLVSATKKPFLITQEDRVLENIKTIVLPFSYSSESVQIGEIVALLASSFNAEIHLVGYRDDDEWLKNDMVRNQAIIKRAFKEHNANFKIVKLESKGSYEDDLIDYANSISADLIAAGHFSGSRLIILKNFVRDIITNKHNIPALTLNAECMKNVGNFASI